MKDQEPLEAEEEELLDAEAESDTESELFISSDNDDNFIDGSGQRQKRLNARRALEDYFEEKQRREEEDYFEDFSIPLDE